jgi:hypothetical protein
MFFKPRRGEVILPGRRIWLVRDHNHVIPTATPRPSDCIICPAFSSTPQGQLRPLAISAPDGVGGVLVTLYGVLVVHGEGLVLAPGEELLRTLPGGLVMIRTRTVWDALWNGQVLPRYLDHWMQDVATLCQDACRACESGQEDLFAFFLDSVAQLHPDLNAAQLLTFTIVIGAVMMMCTSLVGKNRDGRAPVAFAY